MATEQEIKLCKEIILSLLKAQKISRIYPENSPVRVNTIEETFAKFKEFFALRQMLDLWIKPNEMVFDSVAVYQNTERVDNLAFFFFKDGLKQLSFRSELTKEELRDFLRIVTMDFERQAIDDDVVTLLWERDFENIKYLTDEAYLLEDDDYETQATDEVTAKASSFDQLFEAYQGTMGSDDVSDVPIMNLTDRDLKSLVLELDKDAEERKSEKLSRILLVILDHAADAEERDDAFRFFRDLLVHTIKDGDLHLLVSITREATEAREAPGFSDDARLKFTLLGEVINSAEIVNAVGEMFDSTKDLDEGLLSEYTELLTEAAMPPLISLLGQLETIHGRKRVIALLTRLGQRDIRPLLKALGDQRWYLVRNIVYILRVIGSKEVESHLVATVRHPDIRVRREAVKALGELKSTAAVPTLNESFGDDDSLVRRLSAKALSDIGSEEARKCLLDKLLDKGFGERDFEERKEFYGALARWTGGEVMEHLRKILSRRPFFRKTRDDEDKACAAYCLGLMGSPDAKSLLQGLQDSKIPLVRDHVVEALRTIQRGGRGG